MKPFSGVIYVKAAVGALLIMAVQVLQAGSSEDYLAPSALAATRDGKTVFVACSGANQVLRVNLETKKVITTLSVPKSPSGLILSKDESRLIVTCAAPQSAIIVVDLPSGKITDQIKGGHTAMAPVLGLDGKTLFVCNRFNNNISVFDLESKKELRQIAVQREPVAAAITLDGKYLLVANCLPGSRSDIANVAAVVSVIDIAAGKVIKELHLPNGSASLADIQVSPDGKYAAVTHILSRYSLPTTQLERGWMNTNAKTIIDVAKMEILNTVLLDNVDRGAANPWGVAWSGDSSTLVVAHSGTHELSVINFPALLAKLSKLPSTLDKAPSGYDISASHVQADVANDLAFLVGVRQRIPLPESDRGPRALVMAGTKVCSANYFSDSLSIVDLKADRPKVESIVLRQPKEMSQVRKGEYYFHDASICFQGWQSCASCHPGEARVDGLNWDLLNDGLGNPKNTKSLLLSHRTPPAMSLGSRDSAETAVRSGIKYILFSTQPEEVAEAIDAYLKSLKPVPSPFLVRGGLSEPAKKGRKIFQKAGCADCHPAGFFTDLKPYDVGTHGPLDKATDRFDTPTLIETWRTAPYLHDGSAETLRDVVTTKNPNNRHGKTSNLSPQEIDELCAYMQSL